MRDWVNKYLVYQPIATVLMQSPGYEVEIVCGVLDRVCIYVSVCMDAPGRGQHYYIINLLTLSRVIVYP